MDLIAYVTPMNQIAVHRMNWQRLGVLDISQIMRDIPYKQLKPSPENVVVSESEKLIVTTLAWHPDGMASVLHNHLKFSLF
jgi:hypothetical protein